MLFPVILAISPDPMFKIYAATIFAYGQTSSGKTFTMRGVTESAIADIFAYIRRVNYLTKKLLTVNVFSQKREL